MSNYRRKEVIGDCTLYLGDCMEVMPMLGKVDAVVTDPPYGTQDLGEGYGRRKLHSTNGRDGRIIIKNDLDLTAISKLFSLLSGDYYALIFYAARRIKEFVAAVGELNIKGEIIWHKKQMGLGYTIRYSHESIAVIEIGKPERPNFAIDSVISCHQLEKLHPHQKPVELLETLISWQSGLTLDPFMGSGTTGVACAKMGRKFIGIELEPKYFDIACKRIENAYKQPDMFIEQNKIEQVQQELTLLVED